MEVQANLNPIACDPCRSRKCKCDRKLPTCSQCIASPQLCHYQVGGKRGLPAAYMTSLEHRLRDTEAALYSALRALQDLGGTPSVQLHADDISRALSRAQRSKADKQNDWTRQPLQTSDDLLAWFRDALQSGANACDEGHDSASTTEPLLENQLAVESSIPYSIPDTQEEIPLVHSQPLYSNIGAALEKLRDCKAPTAPNVSRSAALSVAWLDNYF